MPGDADGREQPADRGRDQADQQRDQHGDRDRRALPGRLHAVERERQQRGAHHQEDDGETRPAGCSARSRWASSAAWRLPPGRSCGPGSPRPGRRVTRTTSQSESTRVPPVTALRSPPASRMTGALSPVTALSSTEAMPSTTSPSAGMMSPASTRNTSPLRRSVEGTVPSSAHRPVSAAGASFLALVSLAGPAQRLGLGLAAPFGQRLGEVGEQHGEPEPERDHRR